MGLSFFDKEAQREYVLRLGEGQLEDAKRHKEREEEIQSWFSGGGLSGAYVKAVSDERLNCFRQHARIAREALFAVVASRGIRLKRDYLAEMRSYLDGILNCAKVRLILEERDEAKRRGRSNIDTSQLENRYATMKGREIGRKLWITFSEAWNKQRTERRARIWHWAEVVAAALISGVVGALLSDPFRRIWQSLMGPGGGS